MSALAVFSFQESHPVRVVMVDGNPWFVAADVCNAIGIINHRDAVGKLDEDEKGVGSTDTPGGKQEVTIINESGLYTLILRCRDAVKQGTTAWRFRKWVTNEVLPAIRKNGEYSYVEPAPKCAAEPLDWRIENEIREIVTDIAQCFRYKQKWMNGIRRALRRACRTPAPAPLTVGDLPAIIAELRRILAAAETVLENVREYEGDFLRTVRQGRTSIPYADFPPVDLYLEQEKVLPARFELAIRKVEELAAKIYPAVVADK
ncbi:hypothetical protein D6S11_17460 [Salmonella enterica subsp. enterica]|nr:hypothetical protein [Salmonella enterica subsp. enterica serovar Isaszeg]